MPLVLELGNCINKILYYVVHDCRICHIAASHSACISISEGLPDNSEHKSQSFSFLKTCFVSYSSLPCLAFGAKETRAAPELELRFWTPVDVFTI